MCVPLQALHYLVLISEVDEKEIFKICLEYWNSLAADLYRENPFSSSHSPMLLNQQNFPPRRQLYLTVLSKVHSLTHDLFFTTCVVLEFAFYTLATLLVQQSVEHTSISVCIGSIFPWDQRALVFILLLWL